LPLIGHLHLVGSRAPHVSLRELDARYGHHGLLLVRLVSSPAAVEAVMRTHDKDLASRPPCTAARTLFNGRMDVAFSTYGEHWRQARKVLIAHMLSAKRVAAQMTGREEEVLIAVSNIRDAAAAGRAVDLTGILYSFSTNVACRAISRRYVLFFFFLNRGALLLIFMYCAQKYGGRTWPVQFPSQIEDFWNWSIYYL
jgi:homoserine acetyltransferase